MPLPPLVEVAKLNPDGSVAIDPQTGRPIRGIKVSPLKLHVRGYWLVSDPIAAALTPAASADLAGPETQLRFLIDSQGHFDWAYIMGISTGEYSLAFYDPGSNRLLQNRPVHNQNVVGSPFRPFRLPMPYFFNVGDAQREFSIAIRDLSTVANTVRLVLYGRRFYHKEASPQIAQEIMEKFALRGFREYSYFLGPLEMRFDGTVEALAAGASTTLTFDCDDAVDFEAHKLMVRSTQGSFSFTLRERDKNRILANGTVVSPSGWGNAEFPFYLGDSFLLERKRQLLLEITNTAALASRIYPTIAGKRLHYR